MKKISIFILCLFLLVGCQAKEKERDMDRNSNTNTNVNTNSNEIDSNTNTNTTSNSNNGKYDVDFYLFYSRSCEHCHNEREWLKSIEKDYPYMKIHYYEVDTDVDIYNKVKESLEIDTPYVPLTIIGNDYYVGYSETKGRKFLRAVEELSKHKNCDVVGTAIKGGNIAACKKQNEGS